MSPALLLFLSMGLLFALFLFVVLTRIRRRVKTASSELGLSLGSADIGGAQGHVVTRVSEGRIHDVSRGTRSLSHHGRRWREVILGVEVEPGYGAPFSGQARLMASEEQLSLLTIGARLRVRYPENGGAGATLQAEAVSSAPGEDWLLIDTSAPLHVAKTAIKVALVIGVVAALVALLGIAVLVLTLV
jgi:hypothetical protein